MRSIFLVLFLVGCAASPNPAGTASTARVVTKAQIASIEVTTTEAIHAVSVCLAKRVGPCDVPATRRTLIDDSHAAYDAFLALQSAAEDQRYAALVAANSILGKLLNETPRVTP